MDQFDVRTSGNVQLNMVRGSGIEEDFSRPRFNRWRHTGLVQDFMNNVAETMENQPSMTRNDSYYTKVMDDTDDSWLYPHYFFSKVIVFFWSGHAVLRLFWAYPAPVREHA